MAISKIPGAGVSADTLEAGDIAAYYGDLWHRYFMCAGNASANERVFCY